MKLKRWLELSALAVGMVLLLGVAIFGMILAYPLVANPNPKTEHQGIIEQRFTALESGTTEYHFIVNETGTPRDVRTDAVTWYTRQIGEEYTWETAGQRTLDTTLPPFLLIGFGWIGAIAWSTGWLNRLMPVEEPEAIR